MKLKQLLFAIGVILCSILPVILAWVLLVDRRDLTNLAIFLLVMPVLILVAGGILANRSNFRITAGYKLWTGVFLITSWATAFVVFEVWEGVTKHISTLGRVALIAVGAIFLLEAIVPMIIGLFSPDKAEQNTGTVLYEESENTIFDLDEVIAKIRGFTPSDESDAQS